jgi:hypothetical protein
MSLEASHINVYQIAWAPMRTFQSFNDSEVADEPGIELEGVVGGQ